MIFLNRLDAGREGLTGRTRWMIESDSQEPMQRIVLGEGELDQLANKLTFCLRSPVELTRDSGFSLSFAGGGDVHVCYSDEVPELVKWLRENFADMFNTAEEVEK